MDHDDADLKRQAELGWAAFGRLFEAMRVNDTERVVDRIGELLDMGGSIAFATISSIAAIIVKGQTGYTPGQLPEGAMVMPAFSDDGGNPIAVDDLPPHVALSGRMIAAVALDDGDAEKAIFDTAVKLGSTTFTLFVVDLLGRAGDIVRGVK